MYQHKAYKYPGKIYQGVKLEKDMSCSECRRTLYDEHYRVDLIKSSERYCRVCFHRKRKIRGEARVFIDTAMDTAEDIVNERIEESRRAIVLALINNPEERIVIADKEFRKFGDYYASKKSLILHLLKNLGDRKVDGIFLY